MDLHQNSDGLVYKMTSGGRPPDTRCHCIIISHKNSYEDSLDFLIVTSGLKIAKAPTLGEVVSFFCYISYTAHTDWTHTGAFAIL